MNIYTCLFLVSVFIPQYLLAEVIESPASIFADSDLENVFTDETVPETPKIIFDNGIHKLILTEKMEALLTAYNPKFKAWETTDYTESLVESLKQDGEEWAPFAFIMDINKDGINDVVIDGFDGEKPELIAITSSEDSYQVKHIASLHTHSDPKTVESFNDGVVEHGLNYLVWPNRNPDFQAINVFTVASSQETNSKGELLSDAEVIDYRFIEGEFVPFPSNF